MKYVCMLALASVLVYLTHAQQRGKENVAEEIGLTTVLGSWKPGHGKCWRYPFRICRYPGEKSRFDGEKCLTCRCNRYWGETCCEGDPVPVVRKPRHCDIELNRETCEYDLHSRCKGACAIVGYGYSQLADYDEGWPVEEMKAAI